MGPVGWGVAVLTAGTIEPLGKAAFGEKSLLQSVELAVEEVVGLVDEAEQDVGGSLRGSSFDVGPIRLIGLIGPIGDSAHRLGLGVVFGPEQQVPLAEEVLIVLEQFFQAGAGDAGEFELGLLGGGGGLAGFRDVLFAATGGLDHLIVSPRAAVDEAVAESDRGIENNLGGLVGFELPVPAMGGDEL